MDKEAVLWFLGFVLVVSAIVGTITFGLALNAKVGESRRNNNQARCIKLIEAGQYLCSQSGSTQR